MIDWRSNESHVLLNPRMPSEDSGRLASYVTPLPGHIWLATSGTTGALKLAALSKRALLASAAAVNRRLATTRDDVWLCVLPAFHVGGLGILARSFLSGARMVEEWSDDVTLVSLVPAHVSDLVRESRKPPRSLRAAVVGGDVLADELYRAGLQLGWPLLPSYGMTECCSQVATATVGSPELRLLDHLEARVGADGRLAFRGTALLTGYGTEAGFIDPKVDDWVITEDLGTIEGQILRVAGRAGEFVKIGGESVDLARLDAILASIAGSRAAVVAVPERRLGHVIHLAVEQPSDGGSIAAAFNERVHPFERARKVHQVTGIPRTHLGKLMRNRLLEVLPISGE